MDDASEANAVGRSNRVALISIVGGGQCGRGQVAWTVGQGLSARQDASGKREDQPSGRRRRDRARSGQRPDPPGPGNFDAKQVALASAAGQRGRFGALRAAEVAHNPSIWDIDVSQGGKICVSDASKVQLWRPDSETAATVQIHSADGATQDLSWAAGSALTAWPAALPIKNGASYQVEWPDTGEKSSLNFVSVPGTPGDLVGAAEVLIENGCQKQLDLLVESASKLAK